MESLPSPLNPQTGTPFAISALSFPRMGNQRGARRQRTSFLAETSYDYQACKLLKEYSSENKKTETDNFFKRKKNE